MCVCREGGFSPVGWLAEQCGVAGVTTPWRVCCSVVTSPARYSHLSGSPSGKLVFILVEKAFDELVYLYAKVFCSHLQPASCLFSFFLSFLSHSQLP